MFLVFLFPEQSPGETESDRSQDILSPFSITLEYSSPPSCQSPDTESLINDRKSANNSKKSSLRLPLEQTTLDHLPVEVESALAKDKTVTLSSNPSTLCSDSSFVSAKSASEDSFHSLKTVKSSQEADSGGSEEQLGATTVPPLALENDLIQDMTSSDVCTAQVDDLLDEALATLDEDITMDRTAREKTRSDHDGMSHLIGESKTMSVLLSLFYL